MALFPGTHLTLFNSKFIGGVVSVYFGSKLGFLGDFMVVYFILELPICLFIQNCYLFCLSIRVLCCFLFGEIGLLFFLEEVWFLGDFYGSRI